MNWLKKTTIHSKEEPIPQCELDDVDTFLSSGLTSSEKDGLRDLCEKCGDNEQSYNNWEILSFRLPQEYKDLLSFANGGLLTNGEREFGFFGSNEIREFYINYQFPQYMPEALPFGFNGGGVFYAYDFRSDNGNPSIIAVAAGALFWEDSVVLGHSLDEVFSKPTNIEEELYAKYDVEKELTPEEEKEGFLLSLKRASNQADIEFTDKNYQGVVTLLSEFESHLDSVRLKKYHYSKKKLRAEN